MPESERRQFEMTGVDVANQLYGDEVLRSLERKDGRFCNTGMKATLLGAIVSDGLEDGTVISGVGGQYNFVSMAHALPDGRLLMMIKSTRQEHGRILSNIVYNYGHVTIPRHLKDIIELMIAFALKTCKLQTAGADASEISDIMKALPEEVPANLAPFMERMQLQNPATPRGAKCSKNAAASL